MNPISQKIEDAVVLAAKAHAGQQRKEGEIPYITHPYLVALELTRYGFDDVVIAAALTHDVLEDTAVTEDELRAALGEEVTNIVSSVTNDPTLGWEAKKLRYIETVRAGGTGALAVATADKIHNAKSLLRAHAAQGTQVWAHFNVGKEKKLWFEREMLEMLQSTWDHPLVAEYASLVETLERLD